MIYFFTPYSLTKNLGQSYNEYMRMVPDKNDWACFIDGDAMFLQSDFGHQLQEIIDSNPDFHLLTCYTNRVGTKYQCVENAWDVEEMNKHRNFADKLRAKFNTEVTDITKNSPLSGVLMLIKKQAWEISGGFKESGLLGVDNSIHHAFKKAGFKIGLMKGVYVMHYYRNGNQKNKQHLA